MPPTFDWDNLEDIAIALTDNFPSSIHTPCVLPTCTNGSRNCLVSRAILRSPTIQARSDPDGVA